MANRSCHDELISKAAGVTAVVLALACYALVFIPWATNQDRKDQP
jgi:L-fucose isomerase-like protein